VIPAILLTPEFRTFVVRCHLARASLEEFDNDVRRWARGGIYVNLTDEQYATVKTSPRHLPVANRASQYTDIRDSRKVAMNPENDPGRSTVSPTRLRQIIRSLPDYRLKRCITCDTFCVIASSAERRKYAVNKKYEGNPSSWPDSSSDQLQRESRCEIGGPRQKHCRTYLDDGPPLHPTQDSDYPLASRPGPRCGLNAASIVSMDTEIEP
jgi:hypothetical protein